MATVFRPAQSPQPRTLLLLFMLTFLLLSGCASTGRPAWLDNAATDYPKEQFLSAIGEGESRALAATRARANLSQIFQVAISDRGLDTAQSIISENADGERQIDSQQQAQRTISTDARQVLEGSDIVEYWQSSEGTVYSLAVLNRAEASTRFRKAINKADQTSGALLAYSRQASNPVVALRSLEQARLSQLESDNALRNLNITAPQNTASRFSSQGILSLIRQRLAQLDVTIAAPDPVLQSELENAAKALGMPLSNQAKYQLSAKLDLDPLQQKQGWWWLRGSLEMALTEKANADQNTTNQDTVNHSTMNHSTTLAKKRWPVKQSSTDKSVVAQRLKDGLNQQLTTYLYQMLTLPNE